jgi:hypothetical protein
MPSAQECAERLREQAYRTLLPQIRGLEQELQSFNSSLSSGVRQIEQKLEILSHTELPSTEAVLSEILGEVVRRKEADASTLALFAQGVRKKETQEEILGFLLDSAQAYVPRVALFAVRGDRFIGWSSKGFSDEQAKELSSCSFSRSELTSFQEAIENEATAISFDFPDSGPIDFMKEASVGPWRIFPLHAMQRPVAVLLVETGVNPESRQDSIAVLVSLTALRLENIALKILHELLVEKPEAEPQAAQAKAFSAGANAMESERAPEPPPAPAPALAPALQDSIMSFLESESTSETTPEPAPAVAGVQTGAIVDEIDEIQLPVETAPELVADEKATAPVQAVETPEPPPPAKDALKTHTQEQLAEEEKLHAEAKRFARLLISEIKLYNEHHVLEGRENRDLYIRLKRDIDRSREMYEKRVSVQVSRRIDYFHDEIIRILGDNDPCTLGSDYPGPRVES